MQGQQYCRKRRLVKRSEEEAREHIQELRKKKFSIGADEPNPLTQDLHHAVTCLSAELYTKDVHFLMELIQNAEDNQYEECVEPTLEFVITKQDITGCGASETLLVFNNEVGFSRQNMESICSVGRSTKKGKRIQGFIGEKGIGFKSVFLVSKQPHIISNGYKVKFNEEPDLDCAIGYIVPGWISDVSFTDKIKGVYGSQALPTTTIVLPLKKDKVTSVKEELSLLHPELLLFLHKLRRLYVHQDSRNPNKTGGVAAISLISETNHVFSRDKESDSRVIHLSVKEKPDGPEERCQYYIWRQAFPVAAEARVAARPHVDKWILSLAFPFGKRLKRGTSSVGVFAFLPTSMVTNFPFVIQADFILASSRETIVFDNRWNQGILGCVPLAFINAFTFCVKEGSPVFTITQAFEFLPSWTSPFPALNNVRETIRKKLIDSVIIPSETFSDEKAFRKPALVARILPSFRELLGKMIKSGICLSGISSMKISPVLSALDQDTYGPSLDFLGVQKKNDWYEQCFAACNLLCQASDDIYIDVLYFISHNLNPYSLNIALLKFINKIGDVEFCTIAKSREAYMIQYGVQAELHAWLQKCNNLFGCPDRMFFLPNSVQASLMTHPRGKSVIYWLSTYAGIKACSTPQYSSKLCDYILRSCTESHVLITFCHFLYHSTLKKFLTDSDVSSIVCSMPMIDGSGCIRTQRTKTLVPASGSKWAKLFGPLNPFLQVYYVDIGKVYDASGEFAGECTPDKVILNFLIVHAKAQDLPELLPPDLHLNVASSQMTSEQAFLLLDWIRFHRTRGTLLSDRFVKSIRSGKWVKTTSGVDSPSNCTLPNETGRAILEMMKIDLVGFSIVDEEFYGQRISLYTDELKFLGMRCGTDGAQGTVMDQFTLLASSAMSRDAAFSLLLFMGFLKARHMLDEQWLNLISQGRWLKTCRGFAAPRDSVYLHLDLEAEAASTVTSLHVLDVKFYGAKVSSYLDELKLLGLKSEPEVYSLLAHNLSFPKHSSFLTSSCGFLVLNCLRSMTSPDPSLMKVLDGYAWLRTSLGFSSPSSAILYESKWACLLNIGKVPLIDEDYYGNEIRQYVDELKAIGVAVEFGDVLRTVVNIMKTDMAPGHLIALLKFVAEIKKTMSSELDIMRKCLHEEPILKTRHGYKKPGESILFNSRWASMSMFVDLPIIDDSYHGINIYGFRDELKMIGVLSSLEDGATFVARGLSRPVEADLLKAEGTLSLLDCLRKLMAACNDNTCLDGDHNTCLNGDDNSCLPAFLDNLTKSELFKTTYGYRLPKYSLLYNSGWKDNIELTDAPFIDTTYYGLDMCEYFNELKAIGVKVEPMEVCTVLSQSLPLLSETATIKRIYGFFQKFQWKPEQQKTDDWQIWIPVEEASTKGKWVDSSLCVIHDKAQHFAPFLFSLDAYYEEELLPFFSTTFGVRKSPSTDHYMQLWRLWESVEPYEISDAECCFFWDYILKNWNPEMEDILKKNLLKVPAMLLDGRNVLVSKEHVFIPDKLWLKQMFMNGEDSPLFVWLPYSGIFTTIKPPRLSLVFSALGVRKISDSVKCCVKVLQSVDQLSNADLRKNLIVKGLIEMTLGFLYCKIHMPFKERHEAIMSLLNVSVYENNESVHVSYQLQLATDSCIQRDVVKLVHWDKKSQKLYIDRSFSVSQKANAKFVNFFAVEIAEGLLPPESRSVVNDLQNLIQMGFLYEFEEHSVRFLLTRENIEVSKEDEEFLAAAFPSNELMCTQDLEKWVHKSLSPLTPIISHRVKRRRLNEIASAGKVDKSKSNSISIQTDTMSMSKRKVAANEAKDPNRPKKPPTAFLCFMDEFRKQYKLEHPQNNSIGNVSKSGSEVWRAMSDLVKAPYVEMSEKRKSEYEKELKAYRKKLEEPQADDRDKEDGSTML